MKLMPLSVNINKWKFIEQLLDACALIFNDFSEDQHSDIVVLTSKHKVVCDELKGC